MWSRAAVECFGPLANLGGSGIMKAVEPQGRQDRRVRFLFDLLCAPGVLAV